MLNDLGSSSRVVIGILAWSSESSQRELAQIAERADAESVAEARPLGRRANHGFARRKLAYSRRSGPRHRQVSVGGRAYSDRMRASVPVETLLQSVISAREALRATVTRPGPDFLHSLAVVGRGFAEVLVKFEHLKRVGDPIPPETFAEMQRLIEETKADLDVIGPAIEAALQRYNIS